MTVEEFHALENPVGMTFYFLSKGRYGKHLSGKCIKTFKDMALISYQQGSGDVWKDGTEYFHCRQLHLEEDFEEDKIKWPKLELDPEKAKMFTPEEKRNAKRPRQYRKPIRNIKTGEVYKSVKVAAETLGYDKDTIREWARKGGEHSGYMLEYVTEGENGTGT